MSDEIGALILAIEDDPQIVRFLRTTLTSSGYRLLEATTGGEGINQVALHHPDIIILDLGLPDLDGLDVTRACANNRYADHCRFGARKSAKVERWMRGRRLSH